MVPLAGDDAVIPANTPECDTTAAATCASLRIDAGALLYITPSGPLTVAGGGVDNAGTLRMYGELTLSNSNAQITNTNLVTVDQQCMIFGNVWNLVPFPVREFRAARGVLFRGSAAARGAAK